MTLLVVVVAAAAVNRLMFPEDGTVAEVGEQQAYLDGVGWPNNTAIHWGTLIPGSAYVKSLKILNTANANKTIQFMTEGLAVGWTETWPPNGRVLSFNETITGDLTLNVPIGAIVGDYSWNSYILAS